MSLFDVQIPFFRPLWIRVGIVALCLGWGLFELVSGAPFWGLLFLALGLWCAWQFFVVFDPREPDEVGEGED